MQASNNVQTFMEGTFQLSFANTYNHFPDNVIFSALVKAFVHDDKTEVILSNMLPAMAQLLKRIFSDHLDGGRWQDASPIVRDKVKRTSKAQQVF